MRDAPKKHNEELLWLKLRSPNDHVKAIEFAFDDYYRDLHDWLSEYLSEMEFVGSAQIKLLVKRTWERFSEFTAYQQFPYYPGVIFETLKLLGMELIENWWKTSPTAAQQPVLLAATEIISRYEAQYAESAEKKNFAKCKAYIHHLNCQVLHRAHFNYFMPTRDEVHRHAILLWFFYEIGPTEIFEEQLNTSKTTKRFTEYKRDYINECIEILSQFQNAASSPRLQAALEHELDVFQNFAAAPRKEQSDPLIKHIKELKPPNLRYQTDNIVMISEFFTALLKYKPNPFA